MPPKNTGDFRNKRNDGKNLPILQRVLIEAETNAVILCRIIRYFAFYLSDDDDKSDYSSICGPLKVERNRSIIPMNHPKGLLHPGKSP